MKLYFFWQNNTIHTKMFKNLLAHILLVITLLIIFFFVLNVSIAYYI